LDLPVARVLPATFFNLIGAYKLKIIAVDQNSDEWYKCRLGYPTASNAKRIITSTGKRSTSLDDYAIELAIEQHTQKQVVTFEGNYHTRRGHTLEPFARNTYLATEDDKTSVVQVGFCIRDDDAAGCSPDSCVNENGLLEIKCLSAPRHLAAVSKITNQKKPPTDYVSQCQFQLWVTDKEWSDLYFYHPEHRSKKIRLPYDKKFCSALAGYVTELNELKEQHLDLLRAKEPDLIIENINREAIGALEELEKELAGETETEDPFLVPAA